MFGFTFVGEREGRRSGMGRGVGGGGQGWSCLGLSQVGKGDREG